MIDCEQQKESEFLQGAYDLHIHTGPDVIPRKLTDSQAVEQAKREGMAGITLKSHVGSTAGRAASMNERYPDFRTVSGLVLNRQVGGLNPYAVEAFGKMNGDIVWMPTMDAENFRTFKGFSDGITILTPEGEIKSEVIEILELIKKYDLVLASGHLSPDETVILMDKAAETGIRKLWITHITHPACSLSIEQQRHCAELGAMIEHSCGHIIEGQSTFEKSLREIRAVGAEHIILSSDTGQVKFPYPTIAFSWYLEELHREGITKEEICQMVHMNPETLLKKERRV